LSSGVLLELAIVAIGLTWIAPFAGNDEQ